MQKAPLPADEQQRLESLYELELLDDDHHKLFEGACELAAQVFGAEISLVSLVDANRQWFAAKHNFAPSETPRDVSFCGHAIVGRDVMIVPDARLDSRFRDNPLVCSETPVIFYAGAPLVTPDNRALGTLCVIDHQPKYPTERQVKALEQLAKFVIDQMELRRAMLREQQAALRAAKSHRQRSQQLQDLGHDLRTALQGIVSLSESISEQDTPPPIQRSISAMRFSIASLMQIADQLTKTAGDVIPSDQPLVVAANPLAVAAAALSAYTAECERRQLETSISAAQGAGLTIYTDQDLLRLALFHGLGFIIAKTQEGELAIDIAQTADFRHVTIGLRFSGSVPDVGPIERWQAVLRGDPRVAEPTAAGLDSVRDICVRLRGHATIESSSTHLHLAFELPSHFRIAA